MLEQKEVRKEKALNGGLLFLTGAIMATVLTIVAVFALDRGESWDPFTFDQQRIERIDLETGAIVVPIVEGVDGPAVEITNDALVPVRGERCTPDLDLNDPRLVYDESSGVLSIETTVDVWWTRVDDPDFRLRTLTDFNAIVPTGCVPLTFENTLPPSVVESMLEAGEEVSVWRIVGEVTPVADGGVASLFETEPFTLVNSITSTTTGG